MNLLKNVNANIFLDKRLGIIKNIIVLLNKFFHRIRFLRFFVCASVGKHSHFLFGEGHFCEDNKRTMS